LLAKQKTVSSLGLNNFCLENLNFRPITKQNFKQNFTILSETK